MNVGPVQNVKLARVSASPSGRYHADQHKALIMEREPQLF